MQASLYVSIHLIYWALTPCCFTNTSHLDQLYSLQVCLSFLKRFSASQITLSWKTPKQIAWTGTEKITRIDRIVIFDLIPIRNAHIELNNLYICLTLLFIWNMLTTKGISIFSFFSWIELNRIESQQGFHHLSFIVNHYYLCLDEATTTNTRKRCTERHKEEVHREA